MLNSIFNFLSQNNFILPICILLIVIFFIFELKRQLDIGKLFNFGKEVKKAKMQSNIVTQTDNSTFIGTAKNKKLCIPDNAKHIFCIGTTGAGKTIALSNFIANGIKKNYPMVIIDGKGDTNDNSILDIICRLAPQKKKYIINLNDPLHSDKYNPFQNTSDTIIKDMLINMTDWSEEHYKKNTERYLLRVLKMLSKYNVKLSFNSILKSISTENFLNSSSELLKLEAITKDEHLFNIELAKTSATIAQSASARFATIAESELGNIFSVDGIDIYTAMQENAIIVFILNPLLYPETSPLFGRLALIDCKKAVSKLFYDKRRKFFIFDEISSYVDTSLLDLVNKSRSANVTCILATQSLSDLDTISDSFKEQIIENCNNYLILRQNSATNAEILANVIGTRPSLQMTYQLQSEGAFTASETGLGSARRTREYIYHPDEIKALKMGEGIYVSKDINFHSKIKINKPF